MKVNLVHICQNYNTNLYYELFDKIGDNVNISQSVFYPHFVKTKLNKSSKFKLLLSNIVPNYLRHFFLIRGLLNYFKLRNMLNLSSIDIVHCHTMFNDGIIGFFATIFSKRKLVISVRNSDFLIKKHKFWLIPFIYLLKLKAHQFIFISESLKNNFKNLNGLVIGNGIDDLFFSKCLKKKKIKKNNLRLTYIGRIIKRKKLDLIVDSTLDSNVNLTIIGKPFPESSWSKSLIKKIKFQKHIKYYPELSKEEIIKILDNSDIFIMPSINETFGVVYIEAMSRGLPIIFSKGTGVDNTFSCDVGVSIEHHSIAHIKQAIEKISNNFYIFSTNAKNEAKKFNWNKISEKFINIYSKLFTNEK